MICAFLGHRLDPMTHHLESKLLAQHQFYVRPSVLKNNTVSPSLFFPHSLLGDTAVVNGQSLSYYGYYNIVIPLMLFKIQ